MMKGMGQSMKLRSFPGNIGINTLYHLNGNRNMFKHAVKLYATDLIYDVIDMKILPSSRTSMNKLNNV